MAAESSTSGRSGGGGPSADSYIGSLISLTSKSEIRYEGVLYNINAEESSIGLRNVRSFGTEARKKDGPQVPPSDKIYEYILFRGSDIKDLQVKASPPPVQTTPSINSDPAIIQSHYTHPLAPPTSLPAPPNMSLPDHGSHSSQMGLPGSTFQNGMNLYTPGGNMNAWGPSPTNANGTGLPMPMYWSPQGFYGAPNSMPQLPQQPLLRPPPSGLSIPPSMQQMQFPSFNSSLPMAAPGLHTSTLPDYHPSLVPSSTTPALTSTLLTSSTLSLNVPPLQPVSLVSDTLVNSIPNKASVSAIPTSTIGSSFPSLAQIPPSVPDNTGLLLPVTSKPSSLPEPAVLPQKTMSQPGTSFLGSSGSSVTAGARTPSLVTPGQLLHSAPAAVSGPQALQTLQKDVVEVVQMSSKPPPEPSVPVAPGSQPPILPLPTYSRVQKPNGGAHHMRNNYRGRGGRGHGFSRPVTRFTEDFDFTAMNEKFKKDEVWGHLGKSSKSQSKDKVENGSDDEDFLQVEDNAESPRIDIKPLYNKDDFFDSLSCNAPDNNEPNHGRPRYSEQMKLDTETFGDFSRYRGGRGPGRGGGRFRGSYHGRGYGGGGYGYYVGRGRGRGMQNRPS